MLAKTSSITELTEELYLRMVGDYFAALDRIEEIDKRIAEFKEAKKKLPELRAFESFSEYCVAANAHEAFEELISPVRTRLAGERADQHKRASELSERFQGLLPEDVWLRYGDKAVRAKKWTRLEYFMALPHNVQWTEVQHLPEEWIQLEVTEWSKVRPIPKTIKKTGTKPGRLRKSYESGFLSERCAFAKANIGLVAGIALVIFSLGMGPLWLLSISVVLIAMWPYFFWRDCRV